MKKTGFLKSLLILTLVATTTVSAVSCNKEPLATDENTCIISYARLGYGDAWLKQAVSLFNNVYKDQGYKVVLQRNDPNVSEVVLNEVKYPDENEYDLYIDLSENNMQDIVSASYAVLKQRNVCLLECLDDVYNSHPIDTNGNEEQGYVKDSFSDSDLSYVKYSANTASPFYGKLYALQWTSAASGFACNTELLAKYGYEVPRTTNEFVNLLATISEANYQTDGKVDIYPITWAGQNASGYLAYALETWVAQWKGVEGYDNFYALIPETGTTKANGYTVYDDIGIQYAFETANKVINRDYACNGTITTINHLTSNQILADGEAFFCITGDWMYNELISCDYLDSELTNIEMMATPVISELAEKIGLPGANLDEKDACMSLIIKYIDEGKTNTEIKDLVAGVTDTQIDRIKEARGIYYDLGKTHRCFIPSYANAKDVAKLFLRFISSADFCEKVYSKYAHGLTPNSSAKISGTKYMESVAKITKQSYSHSISSANQLSPIRMSGAIGFVYEPMTSWPDMMKGMANRIKGYEPDTIYTKVKEGMQKNWASIITTSGVYDEDE